MKEEIQLSPVMIKEKGLFARAEDSLATLFVCCLVGLPILNVIYRKSFGVGLSFSTPVVQILTLWICYLGAVIACRKQELLCLGDLSSYFSERTQSRTRVIVTGLTVAVACTMLLSSLNMVQSEYDFGKSTSFGVPIWLTQLALPLGYLLIILRTLQVSQLNWKHYLGIGLLTLGVFYLASFEDLQESGIVWVGIALLLAASFFKLPIFITLGGIAILAFWNDDTVISAFSIEIYTKIATNDILASLPLFTLAGFILAEGGASRRLVNLFHNFFGWFPGGVAVATIAVCTFFTTFTGASGVTILAMGGLLKPALDSRGYDERTSIGLITGSSSLGILFPPSLPLILYGAVAMQPITDMFIGAFLPGLFLFSLVVAYGVYRGFVELGERQPFVASKAMQSLWEAKWEAFLPVIVLGVLFSGAASLVETAALTVLYALISEFIVHKDLCLKNDFVRVISYSTVLIGGVLIILTSALGFTNYMIDAEIPTFVIEYVQEHIHSPLFFLLALNLFLFAAGCVMDVFTAIVVISPLLIPLAQAFNIHPVHVGVIFLTNLGVGYLTPPVGMNLFISSYRFKKSMPEIYMATLPILCISIVAVLFITYVPWLTTFLLDLSGGATNVNIELDRF